jgi:hypothetical protein
VIESSSEHVVVDWVALKPGSLLSGVDSGTLVEVIAVSRLPDTDIFNVVYRRRDGQTGVFVADDSTVGVAVADPTKRWLFNADPERFRLTIEAHRIRLAYLFDPLLAVHTSLVEPLPHQITAVYGELLSRHPLRFLLADDPGAGKTIMTGLFIRELMARGDLQRWDLLSNSGKMSSKANSTFASIFSPPISSRLLGGHVGSKNIRWRLRVSTSSAVMKCCMIVCSM